MSSCCIDKTSSAELSEAINSMFRWYRDSSVCYTYLADVSYSNPIDMDTQISMSRWFTRGWTLQELIAPRQVRFYTNEWLFIDSKADMSGLISTITGIDPQILLGADLETASVARRMSWASQRKTTRSEDIAYCLLGIFDVNLPLIYGEGMRAFQRLQEAIMSRSYDQSLFAWGEFVEDFSDLSTRKDLFGYQDDRRVIRWEAPEKRQPAVGLFAETPEAFRWSRDISPLNDTLTHQIARAHPPVLASGSIRLGIVIWRRPDSYRVVSYDQPSVITTRPVQIAILACQIGDHADSLVGFISYPWGSGYHARTPELIRIKKMEMRNMEGAAIPNLSDMVFTRHFMREREEWNELRKVRTLLERIFIGSKVEDAPTSLPDSALPQPQNNTAGIDVHQISYEIDYDRRLIIRFERQPKSGHRTGGLLAKVTVASKLEGICQRMSRSIIPPSKHFIFEGPNMDIPLIYINAKRELFFSGDGGSWDVDIVDLYISLTKPSSPKYWLGLAEESIRSGEIVDE